MRHGKPKIDKRLRLNAAEFGVWVKKYNAAGIDTECQPPQEAIAQANPGMREFGNPSFHRALRIKPRKAGEFRRWAGALVEKWLSVEWWS